MYTQLMNELNDLVATLNNSLPTKMSLDFSRSVDPLRATAFREACLYRLAEITEQAHDAFTQDKLVVAFILCRSFMETEALFWAFADELKESIDTKNIQKIRMFLSSCLTGVKSESIKKLKNPEDPSKVLTPINILTYIDKMAKKITYYRVHYDSLCEFSHPNAAGTIDAYVSLDIESKQANFGLNKKKLTPDLALPQLIRSLNGFLAIYDQTALRLEQFTLLCEELLPTTNIDSKI